VPTVKEERLCPGCNKPLPNPPYGHKYCPVCRSLYGIEERFDLSGKDKGFPLNGRDRIAERLRTGFEMMDEDDPDDRRKP